LITLAAFFITFFGVLISSSLSCSSLNFLTENYLFAEFNAVLALSLTTKNIFYATFWAPLLYSSMSLMYFFFAVTLDFLLASAKLADDRLMIF
jgi:hypothetical protein